MKQTFSIQSIPIENNYRGQLDLLRTFKNFVHDVYVFFYFRAKLKIISYLLKGLQKFRELYNFDKSSCQKVQVQS